ncbi:hypothetical protein FVEG_15222 [Fusarium verticillioides 7600]|uniref:Uncharacterized protein n=1 Tax=Gibberella moniliformis (strain M3125 / FGSC 7600) TaxID=334819 RepID=W7M831_GIBM7|nr:hypothetical protein FVEG_15222 [Fusarium verticillioides 7600]XP_018747259.1 hypothetical protein FVEG_15222 [Fusarium verticillioides 7600]EWG41067.1 hypothetical protein FVEG_15222 [Fusarium verticillioides 7600]EWG41068.1 hypothetical protein FVEG_15222 [Fusarium verticillioides 7600]
MLQCMLTSWSIQASRVYKSLENGKSLYRVKEIPGWSCYFFSTYFYQEPSTSEPNVPYHSPSLSQPTRSRIAARVHLVKVPDDLARDVLATSLVMIHDTSGSGEDEVTELTGREKLPK